MLGSLPGLDASPNIHPVFIHFPIALWLSALAFWMVALIFKKEGLWQVGRWLLNLGLLGALFAVGTGLWAESRMGHASPGHELVHLHKNLMLVATAIAALTALAAQSWRSSASSVARVALLALSMALVAVTTIGADRGALVSLQHAGHDHAAVEMDQHQHSEAVGTDVHAVPGIEEEAPPPAPPGDAPEREAPAVKRSQGSVKKQARGGHDHHDHHQHAHDDALDDEDLSYD